MKGGGQTVSLGSILRRWAEPSVRSALARHISDQHVITLYCTWTLVTTKRLLQQIANPTSVSLNKH